MIIRALDFEQNWFCENISRAFFRTRRAGVVRRFLETTKITRLYIQGAHCYLCCEINLSQLFQAVVCGINDAHTTSKLELLPNESAVADSSGLCWLLLYNVTIWLINDFVKMKYYTIYCWLGSLDVIEWNSANQRRRINVVSIQQGLKWMNFDSSKCDLVQRRSWIVY